MTIFRIVRTETIEYVRDFTQDELVEFGVPPEVFTNGDVSAELQDAINLSDSLLDALTEATEPHGDVQGSIFRAHKVHA